MSIFDSLGDIVEGVGNAAEDIIDGVADSFDDFWD